MSAEAVHIDIIETERKKASMSYSLWTAGVAARKGVCRFPLIDSGVCVCTANPTASQLDK